MIAPLIVAFQVIFVGGFVLGWILFRGQTPWVALALFLILETIAVGAALWLGFRMRFPLLRLLAKARDVAGSESAAQESSAVEDLADWDILETTLSQIGEDLRESKESVDRERVQLKLLLGSISEAVLAIDVKERVLLANPRFRSVFGRGAERSARGTKLAEWIRDPVLLEAFRRTLQSGDAVRFEYQVGVGTDSGPKAFQVSIDPIAFRREGRVIGAMAILHDVSELKKAEKMQSRFIADVSHELRTPLTSIQGYGEMLEDELRDNRVPESHHAWKSVAVIRRNTERLMLLVRDLMDLSSIEAGSKLMLANVSTREVTEHMVQRLQPRLQAKSQSVETNYAASEVYADGARIEQVLSNLLENAHKYSQDGARIRVSWKPKAGDAVELEVSDNGPGIPEQHLGRLFDRFYRLDRSRSRDTGGSGLGLSIVKRIVDAHQGELSVESKPGSGTVFRCRFPHP